MLGERRQPLEPVIQPTRFGCAEITGTGDSDRQRTRISFLLLGDEQRRRIPKCHTLVQERQIAAERAPSAPRLSRIAGRIFQGGAGNTLIDRIGNRQDIQRFVKDHKLRCAYPRSTSEWHRDRLVSRRCDELRVVAGDAQDEIVPDAIDRVENANLRHAVERRGLKLMPRHNGAEEVIGDLGEIGQRHKPSSGIRL